MINAVIFAGGKSSRMGRDKALLPLHGYPSMAALQYQKLLPLFETVYLSSKEEKFDFEAPVVKDLYPESSPMVALASLFRQLEEEALFVLSVDMPLIGTEEISALLTTYEKQKQTTDILIAESPRGVEPLCGIYHRRILPRITALLDEERHRMRDLHHAVSTERLFFSSAEHFSNVNTPSEYAQILSWGKH